MSTKAKKKGNPTHVVFFRSSLSLSLGVVALRPHNAARTPRAAPFPATHCGWLALKAQKDATGLSLLGKMAHLLEGKHPRSSL